jgi:hypothetical protein
MNPLSKFGLTDQEIDAEIARNPEVIKGLEELAHQVEDYWKALAPVFDETRDRRASPPNDDPGAYRDSIHTELIRTKEGLPAARVGTNDYKAVWIEFGSLHMPEYAPATKTAHYFGDTKGPIVSVGGPNEGINQAQAKYREAHEAYEKAKATGGDVKSARTELNRARGERSAAFNAARPRRRGRR